MRKSIFREIFLNVKTSGLTLMEVLIAILIVGILVGLSIPLFQSLLELHKLKSVAEKAYGTVSYARSEAIKRHADVYVIFKTGSAWCYGVNANATCDCSVVNSCSLGVVDSSDYSNVTMSSSGLSQIKYEGIRGTGNNSGSINFSMDGKTITLELNKIGKIDICSSDVGGYSPC